MVENDEARDELDILRSVPLDDPSEQGVESLWRQLMINESFSNSELAEAKAIATREEAESQAALTGQEADTQASAKVADAESEAQAKIESADTEAKSIVEVATRRAETLVTEAIVHNTELTDIAKQQAREMVETALADAQQQTTELRRQTMREIRSVMNHVQEMGAAATEELETQRILTNVAQLKAPASQVEDESDAVDDDWISSLGLDSDQSEDTSANESETESAPAESEPDPVVDNNSSPNRSKRTKSNKS